MANKSLEAQFQSFKNNLKKKLLEAALEVEGEMHNLVAIKTGNLDGSITTDKVIDRGNLLSVNVGSEGVFYAVYVEMGVKNAVYNYHRYKEVVWVGHGQQFIERAVQNKREFIKNKLSETKVN